jgi:hypothetical protein
MERTKSIGKDNITGRSKKKNTVGKTSIALPLLHKEIYLKNSSRYRSERCGSRPIC